MAYPHGRRVFHSNESQLRSILKKFDVNGDDRLDKKELKEVFQHLGARFPGWRAGRGFSHVDANGDGFISEEELDGLIKYIKKLGYTLN